MSFRRHTLAMLIAIASGTPIMRAEVQAADPPAPETVEAVNRFTVELFRASAGSSADAFASPLNVATALGMTALGARGETAEQIARVLHLPPGGSPAAIGALAEAVRNAIKPAEGEDEVVATANAGWFDDKVSILPGFLDELKRSFHADPRRVDFSRSHDVACTTINQWVAEQTRGKIQDLLKPDQVHPGTAFVLTSAIYFKGYWVFPFDPKRTTDEKFQAADGPVPVKLMNQSPSRLPYFEDEEVQAVGLPYKNGSLSMLVVLPKRVDGLPELEASLTAEKIQQWGTSMRPSAVNLSLPRFQSTAEFSLVDTLSKMGMADAFDLSKADFSGITGRRDFALSAVVHKAFVEVEEKGTEAAAATAIVGVRSSIAPRPPVVFRADRPFLYFIRDAKTGAVLFIGRLARP